MQLASTGNNPQTPNTTDIPPPTSPSSNMPQAQSTNVITPYKSVDHMPHTLRRSHYQNSAVWTEIKFCFQVYQ